MKIRSWAKTQLAGLMFIVVGLMSLLTADWLLGAVWGLLGVSLIAYERSGDAGRRFEPVPRNLLALAALIIALALLVVMFVAG